MDDKKEGLEHEPNENPGSDPKDLNQAKLSRSRAKGVITQSMGTIDKLAQDVNNVSQVKEKMSIFEDQIQKFIQAHVNYIGFLEEEIDQAEAEAYRDVVVKQARDFCHTMYTWIAQTEPDDTKDEHSVKDGNETGSSHNDDLNKSTLEQENENLRQEIAALRRQQDLEFERHQLILEKEMQEHELEKAKFHLKLEQQREKLRMEKEKQEMEAEIQSYTEVTSQSPEKKGIGPTSDSKAKYTPGQPDINGKVSTPIPESKQSSRLSWEPSRITPRDEPAGLELAEVLREVLNETRTHQQSMVDTLQMPRSELQLFDGDPLKYWPFIRAFRHTVDNKATDPGTKLTCLLQYCTGRAKSLLQCCLVKEPSDGYKHALELLEERFGNNFIIAQEWIKKITSRPSVKGTAELREFADDLRCCQETLKTMGYAAEMDNSHSMLAIIEKLPYYLQTRWLRENHRIKTKEKRNSKLKDVVNFIIMTADEASDPVFGKVVFNSGKKEKEKSTPSRSGKRQTGSFAIQSSTIDKPTNQSSPTSSSICPQCGQSHYLTQCSKFKSLRVKDRLEFVRSKGLCVNCFKPGHYGKDCPRSFTCSVDGCGQKHSKFLHFPARKVLNPDENTTTSTTMPTTSTAPGSTCTTQTAMSPAAQAFTPTTTTPMTPTNGNTHVSNFVRTQGGKLALPIVPAKVWCPGSDHYIDTYAMLDPGTNATYCTEALRQSVGANGTVRHLELTTIAQKQVPIDTTVISLLVSNLSGTEPPRYIPEVTVRPTLNIDLSSLTSRVDIQRWSHLSNLDIPELDVDQVHLLIGQDCSDLLLPEEVRKGKPGEPFAVRTPLGWAINGPVNPFGKDVRSSHFIQTQTSLESDLERLWALEGGEEPGMSIEDQRTLKIWENARVIDSHYTMDIPFKCKEPMLPDNRVLAEHRLQLLGKRLTKDNALKLKYVEEINQLLTKGYAEIVQQENLQRKDGKVWYLPHHPVLNPKKPDKCRIVFDCAARHKGTSLNDNAYQGPDLANNLVGVLLRFRQGSTAFMADIEGMFNQVKVTPDDRDVLRFLWWENDDPQGPIITLRMTTHIFGGVWSPSCANYALRNVAEEYKMYPRVTLDTILKNFYVDDCLKSVDSVVTAITLARQLKELLSQRGFNLTKWVSNSADLMRTIPQADWGKAFATLDISLDKLPIERALGMLWYVEPDCFGFDVQVAEKPMTKRGVLSTLSTLYDPLGYVSTFVLKARLLFQQLCRLHLGWDDKLPKDLEDQWGRWLSDLPVIKTFRIPRCVKPPDFVIKTAQLHHFCDASENAYGAISYLRIVSEDERIYVTIVMAKARLAPLKGSTIPRLELAGAVESMRLDKLIRKELEITLERSVFWTDSTIVLWYLQNDGKRFQTFVSNRVAKIRENTEPSQWRHVPTSQNPADDASRGLSAADLLNNPRWIHGPDFLKQDEKYWPTQPAFRCKELEELAELKRTPMVYSIKTEMNPTDTLLNYYSSWYKLKKAVAWLLRFFNGLKGRNLVTGQIKADEMQNAELAIVRYVQGSYLGKDSKLQLERLNPVKSASGLLRVGGRLTHSNVTQELKHQLILPYGHHISKLIVEECHQHNGHAGVERVLADTRCNYWILKGRKLVKSVVYKCVTCRKLRGKLETQFMADLPKSRVTPDEPPYSRVGIDYFGPFLIKKGRSEYKRYGCVFTCLATRAVHIEVAHSLNTDSFINALERFIARRGQPKEIRSDNGTNFVGAQVELRRALQEWNQKKIHDYLLQKEVDWIFNPPGASHMGGVWERQIRTIRSVLLGVMKQQIMDDESLMTLLCVVESIINSRPITKLSDDPKDARPLSPNDILLLRSGRTLPPGLFVSQDVYRRRWRQVQYLADLFWTRWLKEYLPSLQQRQKWLKRNRNVGKGDLVLMMQENTPRSDWPLGLVMDTRQASDGLVRSVIVKTTKGTFERPVTKICLLEGAQTDKD
jgi:transposase InsO family protein